MSFLCADLLFYTFQIVGVDEADIKLKKISFVSPIAKSLMGHRINEKVNFVLGSENRELLILDIQYS